MDNNTEIQNHPEENQNTEQVPELSATDAMTGVITEPSATFESVVSSKKTYWVIPTIIFIAIAIVSSYLVTHDEELYSEIKTKQQTEAKKRLEDAVKEGKMSKEQMQEQMEKMDKFMDKSSPFFLVISIAGPIFGAMFKLFLVTVVYWLLFKIVKSSAGYMTMLNVMGLASLIEAMQAIVNTALAIIMGKLEAGINLGMILTAETVGDTLYKFLGHVDAFNFWYFAILGIGFAKAGNVKTSTSMILVFGLWLIWICITSFLKIPFLAMG